MSSVEGRELLERRRGGSCGSNVEGDSCASNVEGESCLSVSNVDGGEGRRVSEHRGGDAARRFKNKSTAEAGLKARLRRHDGAPLKWKRLVFRSGKGKENARS